MKQYIIERVFKTAFYTIKNKSTVRDTAKVIGVSKSTTHKDLQDRLERIDPILYAQVYKILSTNLAERHIRGGESTKKLYGGANSD